MDLNMPHLDGIDTLKILRNDFPDLSIIILTSYHQPDLVKEIKSLGAKGYLLKSCTAAELREAIRTVGKGKNWFPEEKSAEQSISPFFLDDFMKKYQLTKREVEIIRMVGQGLTTKEISGHLFVSEYTINAHRRNIARKLNIHTPVGLLNFARQSGLV